MAKKDSRNTKGRIVDAAWALFYEQGYDETTIDDIVERSETSKGSPPCPIYLMPNMNS